MAKIKNKPVKVKSIKVGGENPFVLVAGPCVIENFKTTWHIAAAVKKITDKLKIPFIFKASYDKANRTSIDSFRGPGLHEGLSILADIKKDLKVPVLSDVHSVEEMEQASSILDVIQIPAFLCRQTDLLVAAGKTYKPINIKKGQFLAPESMLQAIKKIESTGNKNIILTERGTTFGYNNLVTDFRSISIMQDMGCPVIFDASHSVQKPGGLGHASGGNSAYIPLLAKCGIAAGCDGVFIEVHSNPDKALSDGPNMLALNKLEKLLIILKNLNKVVKKL